MQDTSTMQDGGAWTTELRCFRCGKGLMPRLEPGAAFTQFVFVDGGDRRRHICCKRCVRAGDRVV